VVRAVVCIIWYGVQASLGGDAVKCMIEAIWPSFKTWHLDSLPPGSFITAPELLSFTLFWLASLPFLYLSVPALRWMFMIKVVVMPFFGVALFTWALTAGHGWGPLFSIPNNISNGWSIGYAFCYTITATISGNASESMTVFVLTSGIMLTVISAFAINMPDITRYARSPRASWITQAVALPVTITLTELLGTVMAASSQVLYGQVLWNPLDVITQWDNRAAKFFAGLCFAFANIGTNVTGNSIPFVSQHTVRISLHLINFYYFPQQANDLTGMFPKWINIRRGQFICAILGFAICPWEIEAKAARFLAFLNGYTVFLGPLLGSEYFIRCKLLSF
jgi:nucleobase:cation symporter-1, NCS1 family